jgi:hypothetical protein
MKNVTRRDALRVAASAVGAGVVGAIAESEAQTVEWGKRPPKKEVTLEEFKAMRQLPEIQAILGRFNGGSFMCCHQRIFEATGIWIPELVPVFERLDASLALRGNGRPGEGPLL